MAADPLGRAALRRRAGVQRLRLALGRQGVGLGPGAGAVPLDLPDWLLPGLIVPPPGPSLAPHVVAVRSIPRFPENASMAAFVEQYEDHRPRDDHDRPRHQEPARRPRGKRRRRDPSTKAVEADLEEARRTRGPRRERPWRTPRGPQSREQRGPRTGQPRPETGTALAKVGGSTEAQVPEIIEPPSL